MPGLDRIIAISRMSVAASQQARSQTKCAAEEAKNALAVVFGIGHLARLVRRPRCIGLRHRRIIFCSRQSTCIIF
jgi:hypothetical protein